MTQSESQAKIPTDERTKVRRRLLLPDAPHFVLCAAGARGRSTVEAYIASRFARIYGARLTHFLPLLLSLRCRGEISAAVGLGRAADGPLFLEQYLDEPAETALGDAVRETVTRDSLVEIGNLVSTWRGSSQLLFIMLAELLGRARIRWAVFTATPEVSKLLHRLRLNQTVLCPADGRRLGPALSDWGSYYDSCPAVTVIDVRQALQALNAHAATRDLLQRCDAQAGKLAPAVAGEKP